MDLKNVFSRKNSAEKKEETQKQQTVKTVLNWVVSILCICIIVFSLVVAIFTIAGATNERHLMQFGDKIYMNVASDSMSPTFDKSDMIICDAFNAETDLYKLKVGQVITFEASINGYIGFNTHRIIHINYNNQTGAITSIRTRGDKLGDWKNSLSDSNNALGPDNTWDSMSVEVKDIVATWGSVDDNGEFAAGKMLKGVGAFSNWIQDTDHPGEDSSAKVRFFCVIVLPLILLFVIYAFILVRTLIIAKLENSKPVQSEHVLTVDSLSDEEKRRLAEEYLASMKAQADAQNAESDASEGVEMGADGSETDADAPPTDVAQDNDQNPNE